MFLRILVTSSDFFVFTFWSVIFVDTFDILSICISQRLAGCQSRSLVILKGECLAIFPRLHLDVYLDDGLLCHLGGVFYRFLF